MLTFNMDFVAENTKITLIEHVFVLVLFICRANDKDEHTVHNNLSLIELSFIRDIYRLFNVNKKKWTPEGRFPNQGKMAKQRNRERKWSN